MSQGNENVKNARDAAFDRGAAYFESGQRSDDRDEAAARYFDSLELREAFCEGWDEAQSWDDGDSFACSQDPSMRDTHGVPGRDL